MKSVRRVSRRYLYGVLGLVALFVLGNVLLYALRSPDRAAPSEEIIILGGPAFASRIETGRRIANDDSSTKLLLLSTATPFSCPESTRPGLSVRCFKPDPNTTRGEARYAVKMARALNLKSILVVTTADQLLRARLRFSRCWDGPLTVVEAPASASDVLRRILYEDGAMVKALVLQRDC